MAAVRESAEIGNERLDQRLTSTTHDLSGISATWHSDGSAATYVIMMHVFLDLRVTFSNSHSLVELEEMSAMDNKISWSSNECMLIQ